MSSRKLGYVIGVILLAIIFSAPHVLIGSVVGGYICRNRSLIPLPGLGWIAHGGTTISSAKFWQDRFVYLDVGRFESAGRIQWVARSSDPETGKITDLGLELTEHNSTRFLPLQFGERLFFVSIMGTDMSFEVVDGVVQSSPVTKPQGGMFGRNFIWNDELAATEMTQTGFTIRTFREGEWNRRGDIRLPEPDPSAASIAARKRFSQRGFVQCRNQGDQIHLFLNLDGRLYYREGIEMKAESTDSDLEATRQDSNHDNPTESMSSVTATDDLAGWTLIRSTNSPIHWQSFPYDLNSQALMGMFVGGNPAALIVDDLLSGSPVGRAYRFDGTKWDEFASLAFPVGSIAIRAESRSDLRCSYVVVTTTTGSTHVYAVDTNGFRKTKGGPQGPVHAVHWLYALLWYPTGALFWAILLGTGTWALMWWYTKPDYAFGVQTVKLASLGWRGIARLVDLMFLGTTTAALGWLMMRDFDWVTPLEAFNLRMEHPTIHTVVRVAMLLGIWIVGVIMAMVATQAIWGITPGKWICRLRTVRTSLRRCGFARSLAREIVFFVDSGDLFYWAPGILSIAFTDHRQRLGDLVADTIVVNASSLRRADPL